MKRIILVIMILATFVFSATYTTISIDGTNDFDSGTERFSSTSGTNLYGYVTWDASYIYVGFSGSSPGGTVTDNDRVYHVYIDTDPQTTATSGTGTTDGEAWRWDPTLPFTANYHYAFKTIDNSEIDRVYSGSSWSEASMATGNWKASGYWELSIDRSTIGSPGQIYLIAYVEEDWGGGSISGGLPSNIFTNTSTQGAITFNSHWLGFNLTSGETPNDAGNVDQSLAVEISAFLANSSSKGVELTWATDSEIENQGFIISRKSNTENWTEIASFASQKALEGQGSTTRATDYSFVDTQVREGVSYSYQLSDVDYSGKRTDHSDQVQTITYVNPGENIRPQALELVRLYPNPFNPTVTLSYDLSEMTDLHVSVYNLAGELVWQYNQASHPAGSDYSLDWNGSNLTGGPAPSGIYLISIQTDGQQLTRKVTLLR